MDDLDFPLDDVVIFELPAFEDVEAFCERFRSRWPGWSHADANLWLFTVELLSPTNDLPVLFREAQQLIRELGLSTVRFYLDGRVYALEAVSHAFDTQGALHIRH